MKKCFNICLVGLILFALATGCSSKGKKTSVEMKTKLDSVSYIIGTEIGTNFKQNNLELNTVLIKQGIENAMKGDTSVISSSTIKKVMMSFQKDMMAKQDAKRKEDFNKNKIDGDKFIAENKNKPGVITTPSGLQYKIIKAGTGPKPKETDVVKVDYEGKLITGKIFDSSYDKKQPATFPLNRVIKGWGEALQLMPVGSTWELYIPENIAYGDHAPGNIPSGSALIFKVELLSIEKAENADNKSLKTGKKLKTK